MQVLSEEQRAQEREKMKQRRQVLQQMSDHTLAKGLSAGRADV